MKASKQILTTMFALPLLIGSFSTLAHEQKGKQAHRHVMKFLLEGVELTDAQKDQMKALKKANRDEQKENWQENKASVLEQSQAMQKLILADNFDEGAVRVLAEKMSVQQIDKRIKNMRKRHEMLNILTPEQKAQVAKNIEEYAEKK